MKTDSNPTPDDSGDPNASNHDHGPVGYWPHPLTINPTNFKHKSLSSWAANISVGCAHGCRFCFVPSVSANKQAPLLRRFGVSDPDGEWGSYVLLRPWDEKQFLASLRRAELTPASQLNPDGNRAVIYCSTTDAYQVLVADDPKRTRELNRHLGAMVAQSLELIRDRSTLNVRILTRSPLARRDFHLMRSFGSRLVFGMSLPTLDDRLARIYEPHAPAPSQRLKTLRLAREAGLHVYVALAPTYPECDEADLRSTLEAVRDLDPITIFHEPINIRAENVARIEAQGASLGITLRTDVFASRQAWAHYALASLHTVERIAGEVGLADRLHLWPDQSLGSLSVMRSMADPEAHQAWLERCWSRISKWPT